MKNLIISAYPIPKNILDEMSKSKDIRNFSTLTLGQLRSLGILKILLHLRKLECERLFIAISDFNYQPLLPIILLLSLLIPSSQVFLIDFKSTIRRILKIKILIFEPFKLLLGSVIGIFNLFRISFHALYYSVVKRQESHGNLGKNIMYLKTNLWLGVQAGGSIGHVAGVVNGFIDLGKNVDLFSVETIPGIKDSCLSVKVSGHKFNGIPIETSNYSFNYAFQKNVRKITKKNKYDFIYQRLCLNNFVGVYFSRKFKVPLIVEYNGSEVWIQENWGKKLIFHSVSKLIEDVLLKHAHRIITVSKVLADELLNRGIDSKKIVYYPNCIDENKFNPSNFSNKTREETLLKHHISSSQKIITFIGTFGQWHGVDLLADIIKDLVDNHKNWLDQHKVHFLLIGDGAKMPIVKKNLNGVKYLPYFTLTGLIAQDLAPSYLHSSDIFISPHIPNPDGTPFFGSPTKLFEYMAMGKPIIASDLDQIGDVLKNSIYASKIKNNSYNGEIAGKVSLLVKPGDKEEFIKSIFLLIENDQLCKELASNSRKEALEKYTWKNHVNTILKEI